MMNEICKNTFRIWRFGKKNFQVWVLQNNSYLDRLKNIIKNQIFQKKWKVETCVWVEVRARTHPRFDKIQDWCMKTYCNNLNYCLFQFLCNFGIHKFCAYSTPKICGFRFLSFVLDLYVDEEWLYVFGTFQTCFEVVFPWKGCINFAYFHL